MILVKLIWILFTVLFLPSLLVAGQNESGVPDWTAEESMLLYFEAITAIRQRAEVQRTSLDIIRQSLRAYLQNSDPYSDYLSPEEFRQFLASQKRDYAGIGMDLALNADGKVICRPYLDSPATEAGIVLGDELKAVDGRPIADQSILTLAGQIRGEVGTEIRLTVLNARDGERTLTINRKEVQSRSVEIVQQKPVPILRMMAFTQNTVQELRDAFDQLRLNANVILDLRGNPGGSLYDAIDAANLFLRENVKVVGVRKQGAIHEYRSSPQNALREVSLYIWQDASTASAAEVFIAALTQNQYAVSIGPTTYGKGKVQEVIPLSDGSALYITTQDLQTPDGVFYHGRGITATIALKPNENKMQDYMSPVIRLMTQRATHNAFMSNRPLPASEPSVLTSLVQPKVPAAEPTPLKMEPEPVSPPSAVSPLNPTSAKLAEQHPSLSRLPKPMRKAPTESASANTGEEYLLCLDKTFKDGSEAEAWLQKIPDEPRESFQFFRLTRFKEEAESNFLCLGPFHSEADAQQQRDAVSTAVKSPVFLEKAQ